MMKPFKSTLTHPVSGRKMKIDSSVYEPFKAAILQSLKGSKGKTFTELSEDVAGIISKKIPVPVVIGIKRSVPWYVISIRLDLETKGLVETFTEKGKKLIRQKK
ncbi:MAG: hypothetical protein IPP43_16010 [Chitinophagaceae bacterium]|nr:hypothetical protein [Chitinophagaceae bacterium]